MTQKSKNVNVNLKSSVVLLEETYTFGDTELSFYIDVDTFGTVLDTIFSALKASRKLKSEEEIRRTQLNDPIYKIAYNNLGDDLPDEERIPVALSQAREYYLGLLENARINAFYLALVSKHNFINPPIPYEPKKQKAVVLGVGEPFPELEYNIAYPVEKRFKQLLDVISKDFDKWQTLLDEKLVISASIAMKDEVDVATGNTF